MLYKQPICLLPPNNLDFINKYNIQLAYQEHFVRIKDCIPYINERYWVSNYGRIFSESIQRFLSYKIDKDGYYKVTLYCDDGRALQRFVHRIVLACFAPIEDPSRLQVNHMNGDKTKNAIGNLEYCTNRENIDHSINTGLKPLGDNCSFATFTNEQVELICQGIEQNMSYADIYNKLLGLNYKDELKKDKSLAAKLYYIKSGRNWKSISSKYNFPTNYNPR